MTNEQLLREICHVIWTQGDLARVPGFYAADFKAHYSSEEASWTGVDGVVRVATQLKTAFPAWAKAFVRLPDES